MESLFRQGVSQFLGQQELCRLESVRIGVAGCGGIGSNAALLLARSGIRQFLLVDFDRIEASNLNRQQYFPEDVGQFKADVLAKTLRRLRTDMDVLTRRSRLSEENVERMVDGADLWIEALDAPASKRFLVESVLRSGRFVVAASGIGGWGGPPLQCRRLGALTLVGDMQSDVACYPPLAPKVTATAALMADAVLEHLLGPCRARKTPPEQSPR